MFRWEKKGLVFVPGDGLDWMQSHAQVPFTLERKDELRTYFSTREQVDSRGQFRSFSGFVDFNKHDLTSILRVSSDPIVDLGQAGDFDEFGSMAGSVVFHDGTYYLYYCGWTRKVSVPYDWAIGLATSTDGDKFTKVGRGPLLGATQQEPYLQACPLVYKLAKDDWHMFYLSGERWFEFDGKLESKYVLMHASSDNGLDWKRDGKPLLPELVPDECQTSASIFKKNGLYHLFFSFRYGSEFREISRKGYRIGYAWSKDLVHWHRDDSKAGIDVSETGWDSEMIAYPHIFELNGRVNMFYCGNQFGKDGFGWAVLDDGVAITSG